MTNSAGARWLRDERLGRNGVDLGERNTSTVPSAYSGREDGDPTTAAPHVYPFTSHMDEKSLIEWFLICRDAELIH